MVHLLFQQIRRIFYENYRIMCNLLRYSIFFMYAGRSSSSKKKHSMNRRVASSTMCTIENETDVFSSLEKERDQKRRKQGKAWKKKRKQE